MATARGLFGQHLGEQPGRRSGGHHLCGGKWGAAPVLTVAQLAELGVNVSAFTAFNTLHDGETFTRIEHYIPDASSRFDFASQRLNMRIPQAR